MTDCADELLPELLHVLCVCECGQTTSGPAGCSKSFKLFLSGPAGVNHAIYPGVKLRCSKPHVRWPTTVTTKANSIAAKANSIPAKANWLRQKEIRNGKSNFVTAKVN